MAFGMLLLIEWLLLFAAGMTFMGGIKGILASVVILSGVAGLTHPFDFWKWELALMIGVCLAIGILVYLSKKAEKSGVVIGLAGGLATFVVLGAFITPILALIATALVIGTGLIPQVKLNQVLWGMSPALWRALMGVCWIIIGNLML